jgi:hypothetical protein
MENDVIDYLDLRDSLVHHQQLCKELQKEWPDYLKDLYDEILWYEHAGHLKKNFG